jgi:hypothetical protein
VCGRLGYICGDAITCLSRGLDDFARGLFSVRGAALDGADGLHWPAPRAAQCTARPASQPGLDDGAADGWWRRRLTGRGERCAQDCVDLGDQRCDIGIQVQNF